MDDNRSVPAPYGRVLYTESGDFVPGRLNLPVRASRFKLLHIIQDSMLVILLLLVSLMRLTTLALDQCSVFSKNPSAISLAAPEVSHKSTSKKSFLVNHVRLPLTSISEGPLTLTFVLICVTLVTSPTKITNGPTVQ